MYFVYRYQKSDENLYVVRHGTKATAPPLIGKNAAKSRHMLLAISVSIAAIMGGVIMLLLRRVSRPVAALGQWARSLSSENLSEPPPDFSYPELNELAELMKNSLSSVQESLDREHNFLRYASHELRTPIAVIRNNIELLHKIKENLNVEKNNRLEKVVDRIDRAGMNMQYLTETLLWLSRTEMEALPGTEFELDRVLAELVEEMQYLLDRKAVDLDIETSTCSVCLPEFPVRIVLGNLIRNAFQHTWEGTITIRQQGNSVVIRNPQTSADTDQQDLGFGLGLQLTDQLTRKLGWHYEDTSTPNFHQVSIVFGG
jgi:signal transduction histidine kinase